MKGNEEASLPKRVRRETGTHRAGRLQRNRRVASADDGKTRPEKVCAAEGKALKEMLGERYSKDYEKSSLFYCSYTNITLHPSQRQHTRLCHNKEQ